MKTIYHTADSRGHADHGWLNTYHSFSFAGWQHPERIHFGALRVLNDDTVDGGMGFGKHPHRDMEIISIPLEGALEHNDSMGTNAVIRKGEVQVMSAGTGVQHSEFNHDKGNPVKFLQIWIFPRELNVTPRYQQKDLLDHTIKNEFQTLVSPDKEGDALWIHQDAWLSMIKMDKDISRTYEMHQENQGVYIFVLKGNVQVGDQTLNTRDGFGIWDTARFDITASEDAEVLLIEVPMDLPGYLG